MSERIKLIVAYDGLPFRGWQSQATGDSVQDAIEAAFEKLCGTRIVVHGSGRTDSGVHAVGQVAHADVAAAKFTPDKWQAALNAHLPARIRIMKVSRVAQDFHARFGARGKIYTYRIWNGPVLPPLEINRCWHVPAALDFEILARCARLLEGTHNFAGFAANRGKPELSSVRTLHAITFKKAGPLLTLKFRGNGFLYKMVRLLTGSMVRCAQGRASTAWIDELLASEGRLKSSFAAPAEGLCLTRVLY